MVHSRLIAALGAALLSLPAVAATDAEIRLVYEAVKGKFPTIAEYCKLPDDERRKVVVQSTMALASQKKLSDPFGAGPQAGVLLRKDCGGDAVAVDPAVLRWTTSAKPLAFDPGRHALASISTPQGLANKVVAPEGAGPFPAVVLSQTKSMSEHLLAHTRSLVAAGFAVLVVDTFGPRGYRIGVNEPFPAEYAKDAYDALAHLKAQPYVDGARIYQSGYSFGGLAAAMLASPKGAEVLKAAGRFRATVANYGTCSIASPYAGANAQAATMEMLSEDSDRPVLMLMGELDIETPPSNCFPLLEKMKAAGKPVEWHVYPRTTHAWDKAEQSGLVFRTTTGQSMAYRYDAAVTKDATERMIAFFNRYR